MTAGSASWCDVSLTPVARRASGFAEMGFVNPSWQFADRRPSVLPAGLVGWACARLSDDPTLVSDLEQVLTSVSAEQLDRRAPLLFELHLDGSGRIDFSVQMAAEAGRSLSAGSAHYRLDGIDILEFDRRGGGPALAGVFQAVGEADHGPGLAWLGTPRFVARMDGRGGHLRLIVPVPDQDTLSQLVATLPRKGVRAAAVAALAKVAPFLTSPESLRIGLDYLPEPDRLAARLGVEVMIDASIFDLDPALAELGVDADARRRLAAAADRVSGMRRRPSPVRWAPDWLDVISPMHVSVSWPNEQAVLKLYFMLTSGPVNAPDRIDAIAWHHGQTWRARLDWARRQLPVRRPEVAALAEWESAIDPNRTGSVRRRWELDGLSPAAAAAAVSSNGTPSARRPQWWPWYTSAREALRHSAEGFSSVPEWLAGVASTLPEQAERIPFAHLLNPIAEDAWQRLGLEHPTRAVGPEVGADLRRWLIRRLSETTAAALNELRIAGWPFGRRLATVAGPEPFNPPTGEYASFCHQLAGSGLAELQDRYPVLPSLIGTVLRQWHEASGELLSRLDGDRPVLHQQLGLPADAQLTRVGTGAGDTHHDGRSVCILGFGELQVVYKPRDVGLERLYHQAVDLVNRAGEDEPLFAPATVSCLDQAGRYGYVQFVEHRACADEAERARFYRNAGRTLALLFALAGTDCHLENLIASGDQLVLIDAETLFETGGSAATRLGTIAPDAETPGWASVLQVGMLPAWLWMEGRGRSVDISALGVQSPGIDPVPAMGWRAVNTDVMMHGPTQILLPHPACLPVAVGHSVDVHAYLSEVVAGFSAGYRALLAVRDQLSQLLRGAAGRRRRLVRRPTYVYVALLQQSLEPAALTSLTARGLVLERLTRAFLGAEDDTEWPTLVAEQEALARLDVPYFYGTLADNSISWTPSGRLQLSAGSAPLDRVLERLAGLSLADLDWQTRVIRDSFAANRIRTYRRSTSPPARQRRHSAPRSRADTVRASLAALSDAKRVADGEAIWMGLQVVPDDGKVNLTPIGHSLYDGRLGLAIGLFEAARTSADAENADRWATLGTEAMAPLLEALGRDEAVAAAAAAQGLGMSGLGGLLRGLSFLRDHGDLDAARVDSLVERLIRLGVTPERLNRDRALDHVGGAAGLIAPLCRHQAESGEPAVRELIRAAATHLAVAQTDSGGWRTISATAPLTGLAHGASGIALALAEAAVALEEESLLDAALHGLAYEGSTFNPELGNWPDFRDTIPAEPAAGPGYGLAWCTGGPGIALARGRLLQLLPEHDQAGQWLGELRAGADAAAAAPLLSTDHLCCGNLGLVAILRTLAGQVGEPGWAAAADRTEAAVLGRLGELPRSQLGGGAEGIPIPGLMTGLAGVPLALNSEPGRWVSALLL